MVEVELPIFGMLNLDEQKSHTITTSIKRRSIELKMFLDNKRCTESNIALATYLFDNLDEIDGKAREFIIRDFDNDEGSTRKYLDRNTTIATKFVLVGREWSSYQSGFTFQKLMKIVFSVGYILGNEDDILRVEFDGNVQPMYTSAI